MSFTELFSLALGAILMENFVLVKFMGCCPFLGVSKKIETATGMGLAVIFVMTVASAATYLVNEYILLPFDLAYMQTVAFILIIASLVQFVEMFLMKSMPSLYQALGITLAIVLFASVRERLELAEFPKAFEGFPIALVSASLLAMAFMGFQGLKIF